MNCRIGAFVLVALTFGPAAGVSGADDAARTLYTRALARERVLREAEPAATLPQLRAQVSEYETIVRRFPASGYSDNALWQAANLALLAFERFGQEIDRRSGVRLLAQLRTGYPSSSLISQIDDVLRQTDVAGTAGTTAPSPPAAAPTPAPPPTASAGNAIKEIRRTPLPDGVRVSIELDSEATYRAERLENPRRVFFDLKGARPVPSLLDATLKYPDTVVREIRLGRHPQNTTRIVVDMEGIDSYSVFSLYNPFRLVIDFKTAVPLVPSLQTAAPAPAVPTPPVQLQVPAALAVETEPPAAPLPSRPLASQARIPSAVPSANSDGKFSLSRQLGLGISRIVIDAGHGGHDPGAQANGIDESELVLDVAQRLSRLVQKQTPIQVVMTRETDVFIPLDERTAIANREGADLFLSIHANASRSPKAHGIETYFLNFASNPEAEAVAARENATSGRTMHNLPDIVRAIALNNKIDESRDFAEMVQRSMVKRLSSRNKLLRDLGVKQAPFVVLIGAGMPSVLAEISFVTNRQEGQLLKTAPYRQQIAEALFDAVLRYQESLKRMKSTTSVIGAR